VREDIERRKQWQWEKWSSREQIQWHKGWKRE